MYSDQHYSSHYIVSLNIHKVMPVHLTNHHTDTAWTRAKTKRKYTRLFLLEALEELVAALAIVLAAAESVDGRITYRRDLSTNNPRANTEYKYTKPRINILPVARNTVYTNRMVINLYPEYATRSVMKTKFSAILTLSKYTPNRRNITSTIVIAKAEVAVIVNTSGLNLFYRPNTAPITRI